MNTRREFVQNIIDFVHAKSYLEIGICTRYTFDNIVASYKISVDSNPGYNPTYAVTSDNFFKVNKETFDVIFIDALHEREQVIRDINNSIQCLNPNGVIVTHDTLPLEKCQIDSSLCWSAWEAFAHLRKTNSNIYMASVIIDGEPVGVGVICHGYQEIFKADLPYTYENYELYRKEWMNVISEDELLLQLKMQLKI